MGRRRYLPGITNSNTHVKGHVSVFVHQNLTDFICERCTVQFMCSITSLILSFSLIQAERQAVNTTVQGSAADIVKLATVNIQKRLRLTYPAAPLSHQHTHPGDCIFFSQSVWTCGDNHCYHFKVCKLIMSDDVIRCLLNSQQSPQGWDISTQRGLLCPAAAWWAHLWNHRGRPHTGMTIIFWIVSSSVVCSGSSIR